MNSGLDGLEISFVGCEAHISYSGALVILDVGEVDELVRILENIIEVLNERVSDIREL